MMNEQMKKDHKENLEALMDFIQESITLAEEEGAAITAVLAQVIISKGGDSIDGGQNIIRGSIGDILIGMGLFSDRIREICRNEGVSPSTAERLLIAGTAMADQAETKRSLRIDIDQ